MASRSRRGASSTDTDADRVVVGILVVVTVGLTAWQAVDVSAFLPTATRAFWIIAALALVSDWQPLRVGDWGPHSTYVYVSACFTFAILLVWGLAPALLVQVVAALLATIRLRLSFADGAVTIARLVLALTAANYVLHLANERTFELAGPVSRSLLWHVIASALGWFLANYLILVLTIRPLSRLGWRDLIRRTFGYELLATVALLFLAPILVGGPRGYLFTLALIPVLALGQIARLIVKQSDSLRFDPATGALSLRGITSEFRRLIEATGGPDGADDGGRSVGLSIVVVEQAAQVRELFGRGIGDGMLATAVRRIADAIGDDGVVGRVAGDELAVLTSGQHAVAMADGIRRALAPTAYIDDLPFDLSGRIGVAMVPEAGTDLASLIRNADEAAGVARRTGRSVAVYEPRAASESAQRTELLRELHQALVRPERRDEITMVYQPQVAVDTGRCVGMEALLRWTSPRLGDVSPQRLIEVVEPTALMHTLTARVIADVGHQVAAWSTDHLRARTAINVSVRDLVHGSLVDLVTSVVDQAGIRPERIQLEITEGALVADEPRISRAVAQLADAGIAVSVDDFGTGYSSLLYLRSLAVAEVKIDRGLVRRISVDPNDRAIVRSIIEMGAALGLLVIAEGVEDEATREVLAHLHCPAAQGFLFARPLAAADVPSWLRANSASGD